MNDKTIKDILRNYRNGEIEILIININNQTDDEITRIKERLNKTAQEIKELIKAKLPKEKNGMDDQQANFIYGNNIAVFIAGHSEALSEVNKIVEEL